MTELEIEGDLAHYGFLVGKWDGEGVGAAPGQPDFAFAQELAFTQVAPATLSYETRIWSIETGDFVAHEVGHWRALPDRQLEIVISHDAGYVEVSLGSVAFTKIETASDLVARTETGTPITAIKRLYGMVGEELMYAVDMATADAPLSPRYSARLRRVG